MAALESPPIGFPLLRDAKVPAATSKRGLPLRPQLFITGTQYRRENQIRRAHTGHTLSVIRDHGETPRHTRPPKHKTLRGRLSPHTRLQNPGGAVDTCRSAGGRSLAKSMSRTDQHGLHLGHDVRGTRSRQTPGKRSKSRRSRSVGPCLLQETHTANNHCKRPSEFMKVRSSWFTCVCTSCTPPPATPRCHLPRTTPTTPTAAAASSCL
mmetsp:Transcript_20219/g.51029  ORF Transcript_20219/g.51029 Transcript_20219/m.51029 type:complete len:209 (-) Transcript_20219:262-888(-)